MGSAHDRYSIWSGELVRLRAPEPRDDEVARKHAEDSEMQRLGWNVEFPAPESPPVTDRRDADPGHDRRFAVETLQGDLAGSINVHSSDTRHRRFSYGIALFRPYWGTGYGHDAVRVLLRYYFGELAYEKCDVGIYEFNEASLKLHGRLGFSEEGRRRSSLFTAGRRWDEVLLGITAGEFFEIHRDFMAGTFQQDD
jgi:RimJ/RimL family protein N-acetyltransferase